MPPKDTTGSNPSVSKKKSVYQTFVNNLKQDAEVRAMGPRYRELYIARKWCESQEKKDTDDMKKRKPRKPNAYNLFVKEEYKKEYVRRLVTFGDRTRAIAAEWKKKKEEAEKKAEAEPKKKKKAEPKKKKAEPKKKKADPKKKDVHVGTKSRESCPSGSSRAPAYAGPGKFMRIRTFYYLPPKAGFNWRGPARR